MDQIIGEKSNRVLRELGLTSYESADYLSLVARGVMTASKVSDSANVTFSKVYEVLNSLDRKGWVDIESGRPSRYFAKSPIEAFEAAKHKLEGKIKSWEQAVAVELQPLFEKRELKEKPDIWILRGETSVLAKLREMLSKANSEVMIAVPSFAGNLAEKAGPLLGSLRLADVKVLVMVTSETKSFGLEMLTSNVEVRRRDDMFGGGAIVDGEEALLFLGEENKPSLVIWSNHVGLLKFAKDYFHYLWNSSRKT